MTGEKFAYYHCLIVQGIKNGRIPAGVTYDVACRFAPYLRAYEQEMIELLCKVSAKWTNKTTTETADGPTVVAGMKFALGVPHISV